MHTTHRINDHLSVKEEEGVVYYLYNDQSIFRHVREDRSGYRFVLANLVVNRLCKICELCDALGEGRKNIERYVKAYKDHGFSHFFERKEGRGRGFKMTPEKLLAIQAALDEGVSIYRIALSQDISKAAILYHIEKGRLQRLR